MGDTRTTLQTTLGDAYQIERELGGGGMSRVFVATETSLGRRVVVKVLPPELAAGVSIERFRREIALAASMQHPHIVPLLAAGTNAEPLWFTMPYIEGQSLRARLARGGELPIGEAVHILRQVADALAYAHRHGVVHRDIKPENVLLCEGHAMVMDFGVAKAIADSTGAGLPLTDVGVAIGTPTYMSPEQASADPHVDARADIYAFGVLAFEMLTGQPPFTGTSAQQVVHAHLSETAPSVVSRREAVPPILSEMIARCLAKRPADRPQSAEELLTALDTLTTPTGALPYFSGAGAPFATPRWWQKWGVLAAALALVVIVGGVFTVKRFTAAPVRPRVVVAPFTNATGDKQYDELGAIIASWVQDAFMRSATLDVADFRSLTMNTENAKAVVIGSGISGLRDYADAAGASRVLTGSVFKFGDSLEFRGAIVDPRAGTVVATVAPARALAAEPMHGVELLAERAAGALATTAEGTAKGAFAGAPHLPTLAAYREFSAGVEAYSVGDFASAVAHFQAAVAADSAFLSSRVWLVSALGNFSTLRSDSILALYRALDRRRAELSPLDQALVESRIASALGQRDGAIAALRRASELWPDRYATNLVGQLLGAGRPSEALKVAGTVDPAKGFLRGWATHYSLLLDGYLLVGDFKGALGSALRGLRQFPDRSATVCGYAIALGVLGRTSEADSVLRFVLPRAHESPRDEERWCRRKYAVRVATLGPAPKAAAVLRSYVDFLLSPARRADIGKPQSMPVALRHFAAMTGESAAFWAALAGEEALARAMYDSLAREQPESRIVLLQIAWHRALERDKVGALATEQQALALPERTGRAGPEANLRARIAVALGDRDGAVRLLHESMRLDWSAENIYFDPALRSLHGYAPFEALIQR